LSALEIDIIGSGLTSVLYDWKRKTTKWSVGSSYTDFGDNVDLYFNMHPKQTIPTKKKYIDLDSYPLEKITELTGSQYFTNSASYMLAYALYSKASKVNLFGIDMEAGSEYVTQRPSVTYWIGYLRAKGVEVSISNKMDKPPLLYGYDMEKLQSFIEVLENRRDSYKVLADKEKNDVKKNQFIGAMFATDKVIQMIRG
jgi:hypothetical protein